MGDHLTWDFETDLVIAGAGAAGMAAALVAKCEGLEVLVCEKTAKVGGTTSTAGGTTWVPGNALAEKTKSPDNLDDARIYLDGEIGPDASGLREAFLTTGREAIDYFERNTEIRYKANDPYPDYHSHEPGGAAGGRGLSPLPFDGRRLGKDFESLRPPIPELMALGGMMVSRDEIKYMIRPWRSVRAFSVATQRVLRYLADRLRFSRGTRLVLGNALAGRLFYSCRQRQIEISLNTKLVELVKTGGRVEGAIFERPGGRFAVRARQGVILATGGVGASRAWRDRLAGTAIPDTLALSCASGDGVETGICAGGEVVPGSAGSFWWAPASRIHWPDGRVANYPHIRDRGKPGLIAVNGKGRRFVNEASSYHDVVQAMLRLNNPGKTIPAWLICDRVFVHNYGLGVIPPVWQRLSYWEKIGYVTTAPTIAELAKKIGVDPIALQEEVALHNRDALAGVDTAFGKGSTPFNRHNGDPEHRPNPCLKPIETKPFFAVAVYPAPLGASAGLRTDADCRVLDLENKAIPGLYACGNDMHSVMEGNYPGPGSTLGPAIVFAYRAAMHVVRSHRAGARPDAARTEQNAA
jgi:3-oxosteroid 1-dehydrogenase